MRSRILGAWLTARRLARADAGTLARHRARLWDRLQPALAQTPALAALAGRPLAEFPIVEPDDIRADYGRWNSLGLTDAALRAAAARAEAGSSGEAAPGIVAGFSTGTSGTRGLFVAGAQERATYIGQSLARLLPARRLLRGVRIALVLRANSALYSDVGHSGRVRFAYVPLDLPPEEKAARLAAFAPDILVAPPHVLAELARTSLSLRLDRCFYGAEPIGPAERDWIGQALGARPDPIYQATEGFLGAACRHGRLHLNEDTLAIELEPVAGTAGFRPIVTDLRRTSQPIVRVRLDDFIELEKGACPCGFAGRAIRPVMGRVGDLWRYGAHIITPGEVIAAAEAALGPAAEWRAEASSTGVRLLLASSAPEEVTRLFAAALALQVPVERADFAAIPAGPKRRRVVWHDG